MAIQMVVLFKIGKIGVFITEDNIRDEKPGHEASISIIKLSSSIHYAINQ